MWRIATISALTLLAGCGHGSNGGSPTPPPTPNVAPSFTSAAAASVSENATGTVYQAVAVDTNGDSITYTLGGADAGHFALSSAGALSFRTPPNFEAPADADANGVYTLTITASDGTANTTLALALTVTNAMDVKLRKLGSYSLISDINWVPQDGSRLFIAQRNGQIFLRNLTTGTDTPYLTVTGTGYDSTANDERGLLDIAPAPDFVTSGLVYVSMTDLTGDLVVRRYSQIAGVADPSSGDVILRVPRGNSTTFRNIGGWLRFGPEGFLYIGTGVREGNPPSLFPGVRGCLLRVDVSRDQYPADAERDYAIPGGAQNFYSPDLVYPPEPYNWGWYSPRRAFFVGTDRIMVADQRQPDGSTQFRQSIRNSPLHFLRFDTTGEIQSLSYSAGEGVTVGPAYGGPIVDLYGRMLFGDLGGPIQTIPYSAKRSFEVSTGQPDRDLVSLIGDQTSDFRGVLTFTYDWADKVYVADYAKGSNISNLYIIEGQ